jgi:hypothetical protein
MPLNHLGNPQTLDNVRADSNHLHASSTRWEEDLGLLADQSPDARGEGDRRLLAEILASVRFV